jgi:hypothetical protein
MAWSRGTCPYKTLKPSASVDVANAATTRTANLAFRNGDLGIKAVAGVTDGGGNQAAANGNPAQCTNVVC